VERPPRSLEASRTESYSTNFADGYKACGHIFDGKG